MNEINKGDIVGRKCYGKDIFFKVERIIKNKNKQNIAILKGITVRIEADSPLEDLEIISKDIAKEHIRKLETRIEKRAQKVAKIQKKVAPLLQGLSKRRKEIIYTGKILHVDGDKRYSEKSAKYYKNLKLNAIVRNIPENRQPRMIVNLLEKYKPDILVVTGHDGMIKKESGYMDIYNYRNSKYFFESVKEARKWENSQEKLIIFAGACQSYYELLISAGANFASSPARILIDFMDPLIVAEKIATTEKIKYLTINDIADELRDGSRGISGIGARGKKDIMLI